MPVTPTAFKQAMKRHGVTSGQIAGKCGVTGASIGSRLRYGHQPTREMRLALLSAICERREELYRSARRHRAAASWTAVESVRRPRVNQIAALLDQADQAWLADWLLRARPERLREIAAGVAVHALAMGFAEIWDGLIEPIEIMDVDLAIDWFDGLRGSFTWIAPNDGLFP